MIGIYLLIDFNFATHIGAEQSRKGSTVLICCCSKIPWSSVSTQQMFNVIVHPSLLTKKTFMHDAPLKVPNFMPTTSPGYQLQPQLVCWSKQGGVGHIPDICHRRHRRRLWRKKLVMWRNSPYAMVSSGKFLHMINVGKLETQPTFILLILLLDLSSRAALQNR